MLEGNSFALEQIARFRQNERLCEAKVYRLVSQGRVHNQARVHSRLLMLFDNLRNLLSLKPKPQLKIAEQKEVCCNQ